MSAVALLLLLAVLGAVAILGLAKVLVDSMDTRPLGQIVEETATNTVAEFFASDAFKDMVLDAARSNPRYTWTIEMARYFRSVDPTLAPQTAFDLAVQTTNEYLRDEGIEFGDEDYVWDAGGARDVADDYEVDHWERPAA